jgi:putative DNA primase/helicase
VLPEPAQDNEIVPQALTEHGAAVEFAGLYSDTFRCVHEWQSKHGPMWLTWDGTRWKRDPARVRAMQLAEGLAAQYQHRPEANGMTQAAKAKFGQKKYITSFLDLVQFDARIVAHSDQFDADPMYLGTPDGTVDLRTGKLIEAEREHCITRQTTVGPKPGPHPLFDDVVRRASGGDTNIRDYIWRWLGIFLMGNVPIKGFLFLWGKRDSGKTTLIETVAGILGKTQNGGYSTTIDMELITESRLDKGNEKLAHLFGARLAYASETEEGRHWKASLLKLITGKDTLEGRFLYSEKFSFKPSHKLVIFGNERPHLKQKDEGLESRLHLLEYPGVISREEMDEQIDEKLIAEYPAILHSMILGCLDFQQYGLAKPESVSHAVSNYMDNEDTLEAWLAECAERDPSANTPAGEVYRSFRTWAESNGEAVLGQKRFSAALENKGFGRSRSRVARLFVGLRIKPSDHERNPPPSYYND